jgi:GNAT superfamily N-acetyltransferase
VLAGLGLGRVFGPPTPRELSVLQTIGASILLLATIYVRGPAIRTYGRETLIERVDRWLSAPEHANDGGPPRVWNTYSSGLFAFIDPDSGTPVGIAEASGYPIVSPGWWIDSLFRGKGYGSELVDVLASYLKAQGCTQVGRISIQTHLGKFDEQSSRLAQRFRSHFHKQKAG